MVILLRNKATHQHTIQIIAYICMRHCVCSNCCRCDEALRNKWCRPYLAKNTIEFDTHPSKLFAVPSSSTALVFLSLDAQPPISLLLNLIFFYDRLDAVTFWLMNRIRNSDLRDFLIPFVCIFFFFWKVEQNLASEIRANFCRHTLTHAQAHTWNNAPVH